MENIGINTNNANTIHLFEIGDVFFSTCPITGGRSFNKIVDRTENKLICESEKYEADGVHRVTEEFNIVRNDNGESVVTWEYSGHRGEVAASEIRVSYLTA